MGLEGPAREITVQPRREPKVTPAPAPAKEPARPSREKVPA